MNRVLFRSSAINGCSASPIAAARPHVDLNSQRLVLHAVITATRARGCGLLEHQAPDRPQLCGACCCARGRLCVASRRQRALDELHKLLQPVAHLSHGSRRLVHLSSVLAYVHPCPRGKIKDSLTVGGEDEATVAHVQIEGHGLNKGSSRHPTSSGTSSQRAALQPGACSRSSHE